MKMRQSLFLCFVGVLTACGSPEPFKDAGAPSRDGSLPTEVDSGVTVELDGGLRDAGPADGGDAGDVNDAGVADAGLLDAGVLDGGVADGGVADAGPMVDRTNPQLYRFRFSPAEADADAGHLPTRIQLVALDTRTPSRGRLVVYLHGAGAPATCGSAAHVDWLATNGFHVISPCYVADYGVASCATDIGGCRLEAFDGLDRTAVITVPPADSIEVRVVRMLERLQQLNPQGDWRFFIENGRPRWSRIVISGISHGASTAGLISKVRSVDRAVMLSGPLDTNQAWLSLPPMTPSSRVWGFTHEEDPQHSGHLAAFSTMNLPGLAQRIEAGVRPWQGSHRLFTNLDAGNPHASTEIGAATPRLADGGLRFESVWLEMYGLQP
jgi:hypothetical protein